MAQESWTFGTHQARFEPPDILWVKFVGPTRVVDAYRMVDICRPLFERGPLYWVGEVAESSIEADARQVLVQNIKWEVFPLGIMVGAGFVQRAMSKAMALALLFMGKTGPRLEFASTLEQARQIIERDRAERAQQKSPPIPSGR